MDTIVGSGMDRRQDNPELPVAASLNIAIVHG